MLEERVYSGLATPTMRTVLHRWDVVCCRVILSIVSDSSDLFRNSTLGGLIRSDHYVFDLVCRRWTVGSTPSGPGFNHLNILELALT